MNLLIAAFVVCALVMTAMAVGVIVSNIRIKGTCGGLGAMKDELGQPMCECGAREGEDDAATDALAGAGDQGTLAVQSSHL